MRARQIAIVIMGISGSGKTTVGAMLAGRLQWRFRDGDSLHPATNIAKMSRGVPLTDEDRWPWLRAIVAVLGRWAEDGQSGVITCSALKHAYRRIIIDSNPAIRLVYLKGRRDLILQRMMARHGHFMPISLLDSQLQILEEPEVEEHPIVVSIERSPEEIVTEIVARLALTGTPV
jgi:carbohydrate kinase (thermoresistant glucokinase family)